MVLCYCGRFAIVRTSKTDTNPGRRFYCCAEQGSNCGFFMWFDPPMCARSTELIPGLLKSKMRADLLEHELRTGLGSSTRNQADFEKLEQEISKKNTQIKYLLVIIAFLCLMLLF
ncbi:hypothetical protein SSX86_031373 [Deinandra increscens subsp. villosa]|uniref:GRF-type domain-containing protein n=1 Tax=Deinandra increscens subsp. villosa TaxID=3103831 RepID=A0AAP0C9Q2_9ASTR